MDAAGIDECVHWLEQDVLDLLSLRGVVTKLSANWQQLKLSLREKGLLRDTQSLDDLQGPTSPAVSTGSSQAVLKDTQSVDDFHGPTPPTISAEADTQSVDDLRGSTPPTSFAESAQAVPTKEAFTGPVRPTDTSGHNESNQSIELSTEPISRESFIGPVIPTDAAKSTDNDVELISIEPGPGAVKFIGPVIPADTAKSTSGRGEITPNQTAVCYVEDEGTESVIEQNENGSMETSESATVQSSGLQMS